MSDLEEHIGTSEMEWAPRWELTKNEAATWEEATEKSQYLSWKMAKETSTV